MEVVDPDGCEVGNVLARTETLEVPDDVLDDAIPVALGLEEVEVMRGNKGLMMVGTLERGDEEVVDAGVLVPEP